MPTFTQSAFVRVDNPEQRRELCEWLIRLGYNIPETWADKRYSGCKTIRVDMDKVLRTSQHDVPLFRNNSRFIDCGTNVEMFCALAALRDDSDYMQWFVCQNDKDDDKSFVQCTVDSITKWYHMRWYYLVRKATPTEIVEHFKNK